MPMGLTVWGFIWYNGPGLNSNRLWETGTEGCEGSAHRAQVKAEEKVKAKDNDIDSKETETKGIDAGSHSPEKETDTARLLKTNDTYGSSDQTITIGDDPGSARSAEKDDARKKLCRATMQGCWKDAKSILEGEREPLNSEKNTVLHLAVGIGDHGFIKELVQFVVKKEASQNSSESALTIKNSNGSTALHVAAIVGNRDAAELLVGKNNNLLVIEDNEHRRPLFKAYSNMQFDTFIYLWEAAKDDKKSKDAISDDPVQMGVKLLVNANSAKKYGKASEIVEKFPEFATENDEALVAITRTFPNGLDYLETLIYPLLAMPLLWVYLLLRVLILMVYLPFYFVYFHWWNIAARLGVPPVKGIVNKKKEWDEAKKLLELVCNKIENANSQKSIYENPILEAARRNAYQVFDEILHRSPEAIHSTDENGYDFIQLAVIHRSEKIYNLIYKIGERKSHYGTFKDSSENNILHLVSRLAPSHELNYRTGAALQLQRELQWHEELKKLVFPAYINQENIFKETPAMVFTREHKDLVKEGEKWMKTTAESCSITAGLITTIVFAAAITVPGGNRQETGIPVFKDDIAFIIFAASDAISLFASSKALLVFLSILTARFAEQDFLISLPRRLNIGFCALLLSTTAMIVSFSAILYIKTMDDWSNMWISFHPNRMFVALQFSLIVDLYQSTYVGIFGQKTNWRISRFDPRNIQGYYK
ncbi:hypothetical protein OSB04_015018 [Centaurea solstitialis]|uniref:PGG domain-containing protein n=1 Tax=Centaurea solstitialis TaxID=347529 RepID=A0AA38TI45_9ASTR|nr:hypothetical protein OSB04_015018 [Centaurea solstitialis]